jgi:hypothetical protein
MPIVLGDVGPLMVLGKLNQLELLASLCDRVNIPRAVYDEVATQGLIRGARDAFAVRRFWRRQGWPIIDVPDVALSAYAPPVILGLGETQVLAWATSLADRRFYWTMRWRGPRHAA